MGGRCPATKCTQSLGGLLTRAHVLPQHVLKHKEDARPTTTWTQSLGGPFVEYKGHHSSDPLFTTYPGGMSVIRVNDIQPFKRRQTYLVPILFQDCCFVDSEIYTKEDLIQKLCITSLSLATPPPPPPPDFCPGGGGYCPFCPFGGDIGPFCHP